jgi:SAM-dependent methyltransferase
MSLPTVLDLGCGSAKTPGALGVDVRSGPGVDVVHDLDQVPWPLPDDHFERVICAHVLEHLANLPGAMAEIHRVARAGALVLIATPHFSSLNSWEDPTHVRHLARRSFSFFDAANPHACAGGFRTRRVEVSFGGGLWDWLGRCHYALWPNLWEKHFCFVWRARNMRVELEVVK